MSTTKSKTIDVLCADVSATSQGLSGYFQAKLSPVNDGVVSTVSVDRNCGDPMIFRHAGDDVFMDNDGRCVAIYTRMSGIPVTDEDITAPFEHDIFVLTQRIEKALTIVHESGALGQPLADAIVRALTGDAYDAWVRNYNESYGGNDE